ncbi:MAG TPA: type II secretion system minor pseudopilin GspK [Myxococcota bacterium]|jgi:general secretion pathway protein K|nr:type II secretion system minor pseudopilin GspK [Myxococcota bacterium]
MRRERREERRGGFILMVVLVFILLLVGATATFLRRASVDAAVIRHRDAAAEAEAAARGGVRLAITLLLEDKLQEQTSGLASDTAFDVWARASAMDLPFGEDVQLRLRIEDAGARLNLNAMVDKGVAVKEAEIFLTAFFQRVIEEMGAHRGAYDAASLAENLLDYLDADEVRQKGGSEDDAYASRTPPQRPANRPLLSVDELRQVEGFDAAFVDALRPYVTVFPYGRGGGINLNTAPPHVLALLFHGTAGQFRFADEDTVRAILKAREQGEVICPPDASNPICVAQGEVIEGTIFPPPTFATNVFTVHSEARVGEVRRTIEAVVDRSKPSEPQLLFWRVL